MLQECAVQCDDIRIFDEKGKEVPFVILNDERDEIVKQYVLDVLDYEEKKNMAQITVEMPDDREDISIIELNIKGNDFKKSIDLEGSDDRSKWDHIVRDTIYDFSSKIDLRKTSIEFPESGYKYYRLTLQDLQVSTDQSENIKLHYKDLQFSIAGAVPQKMRVDGITGLTGNGSDRKYEYDKQLFNGFTQNVTEEGNTEIIVKAALPASKISFDVSNAYYFRKITIYVSETGEKNTFRPVTSSNIFAFPVSNDVETKNNIEIKTQIHSYYKFVVKNGNNPPLQIKGIEFEWIRKILFFVALDDSRQYILKFGDPELKKPVYDLVNFIHQENWTKVKSHELLPGDLTVNRGFSPVTSEEKKRTYEKATLTVVIVMLVFIIGIWLFILLKKTKRST